MAMMEALLVHPSQSHHRIGVILDAELTVLGSADSSWDQLKSDQGRHWRIDLGSGRYHTVPSARSIPDCTSSPWLIMGGVEIGTERRNETSCRLVHRRHPGICSRHKIELKALGSLQKSRQKNELNSVVHAHQKFVSHGSLPCRRAALIQDCHYHPHLDNRLRYLDMMHHCRTIKHLVGTAVNLLVGIVADGSFFDDFSMFLDTEIQSERDLSRAMSDHLHGVLCPNIAAELDETTVHSRVSDLVLSPVLKFQAVSEKPPAQRTLDSRPWRAPRPL